MMTVEEPEGVEQEKELDGASYAGSYANERMETMYALQRLAEWQRGDLGSVCRKALTPPRPRTNVRDRGLGVRTCCTACRVPWVINVANRTSGK